MITGQSHLIGQPPTSDGQGLPPGVAGVFRGPYIIRGSAIKPRTIEWLDPGWIAIGFISLFAGKTGVGKSLVACDLIKGMLEGEVINSVLWIGEDPPDKMTIPRLNGMGIDPDKFAFLTDDASDIYTLGDLRTLELAWLEAGQPKLIVIDPPAN